ncbi:MAG: hypothetical protein ACLU8Y_01910 [Clostridia bacterium]
MREIKTNLGQVQELELKSFKNKLKKIKKNLGISQDTRLKDDKFLKGKEELMILSSIIGQMSMNIICMNWFSEEDSDYIYQELCEIDKKILETANNLTDIYTTILKSMNR